MVGTDGHDMTIDRVSMATRRWRFVSSLLTLHQPVHVVYYLPQCMPIIFMTHRSFSVISSSHVGNLSQVQVNLHPCNCHRLPSHSFVVLHGI